MTISPPNVSDFNSVLDEHRRLRDLIRLLQFGMLHPAPNANLMRRLLDELDGALRAHFEHEEHGGYLHDAVSTAPRLSTLAVRLLDEHAGFLTAVVTLRRLCGSASDAGDWSEFADAYAHFCRRFDEHEAAENRLVQDAMLRDMQAED
jgi:hypothetical protein